MIPGITYITKWNTVRHPHQFSCHYSTLYFTHYRLLFIYSLVNSCGFLFVLNSALVFTLEIAWGSDSYRFLLITEFIVGLNCTFQSLWQSNRFLYLTWCCSRVFAIAHALAHAQYYQVQFGLYLVCSAIPIDFMSLNCLISLESTLQKHFLGKQKDETFFIDIASPVTSTILHW